MQNQLLNQVKQLPLWTVNAPFADKKKVPYDLIDHSLLKNKAHLMPMTKVAELAKKQNIFDGSFTLSNVARQTHLLAFDMENFASPLYQNLMRNLPFVYLEKSVHGGLHGLLPLTDEQIAKFAPVMDATVLYLGEQTIDGKPKHDVEIFANGWHYITLTGKKINVQPTINQAAQQELIDNTLTMLCKQAQQHPTAVGQMKQTVDLTPINKFSIRKRNFANWCYQHCTLDKLTHTIERANTYASIPTQMHKREFALIATIANKVGFFDTFKHVTLSPADFIVIVKTIAQKRMEQLGWQRKKWNKVYFGKYDYLTYITMDYYRKYAVNDTKTNFGEL